MSDRGWALRAILAASLFAGACGYGEQKVVDQYFMAVNAKDTQTLSSFALVGFDKKVDKWRISQVSPEARTPAAMPDLLQKMKAAETAMNDNLKAAKAFSLDHYDDIQTIQKKNGKVPPNLQAIATEWDKYNTKNRDFKKAFSEAKDAADREKKAVLLSLTDQPEDISAFSGEVVEKKVGLDLTTDGKTQPFTMTLRKYDMHEQGKPPRLSRWIVTTLEAHS